MNNRPQLETEHFQLVTELIQREVKRYWESLFTISVLASLYAGQEPLETVRMLRETLTIEEYHVYCSTGVAQRYLKEKNVRSPHDAKKAVNT